MMLRCRHHDDVVKQNVSRHDFLTVLHDQQTLKSTTDPNSCHDQVIIKNRSIIER